MVLVRRAVRTAIAYPRNNALQIIRRMSGLVFCHSFDEVSGTFTSLPLNADPSASVAGSPTYNSGGAHPGQRGLGFDGVDDRVTITGTAATEPGTGAFTLLHWMRTANTAVDDTVFCRRDNATPFTQWGSRIGSLDGSFNPSATKRLSFVTLGNPLTERRAWTSNADVIDGNAHLVVWRRNGNTVALEVDGTDRAITNVASTGSGTPNVTGFTSDAIEIGTVAAGNFYTGDLDFVTYCNVVVPTSETLELARALRLFYL